MADYSPRGKYYPCSKCNRWPHVVSPSCPLEGVHPSPEEVRAEEEFSAAIEMWKALDPRRRRS